MVKRFYECCIFDLDGTLLDRSCGLLNSLDYTITKCGLTVIGPPIKVSFKKQYGLSEEEANKALAVFCEYYEIKAFFCFTVSRRSGASGKPPGA